MTDSLRPVAAILQEMELFAGRLHVGWPVSSIAVGDHDVILLRTWSPSELLSLARQTMAQIVVYSMESLAAEMTVFFDWQLTSEAECEQLIAGAAAQQAASREPSAVTEKSQLKAALFLDRDGVVNVDHGYVGEVQKVELIPHVANLVARANHHKKFVVVVTNQSGIGRGYYSESDFHHVMQRISEYLRTDGGHIDHVEFSPFHPLAHEQKYRWHRQFRKPRPGMIHRAARLHGLDLSRSMLIGDRQNDVIAGVLAGVGQNFLLASDQILEDRRRFENWRVTLEQKLGLSELMKQTSFHVLSGLEEARV